MEPLLTTVVAAMLGAFPVLWKKLSSDHAKLVARNDECEQDRKAIREELSEVKRDVAIFKGCPSEPCGARQAFHRQQTFSIRRTP